MGRVTTWLATLSFLAGAATFALGVRVGHGQSPLSSHLVWGAATLGLQLFTACVAAVHSRASAHEIAALRDQLERREAPPAEG